MNSGHTSFNDISQENTDWGRLYRRTLRESLDTVVTAQQTTNTCSKRRWFSAMQQAGVSRLTTRCVLLTTLTPMWPSALKHEDMVKKQNEDSRKLGAHFPLWQSTILLTLNTPVQEKRDAEHSTDVRLAWGHESPCCCWRSESLALHTSLHCSSLNVRCQPMQNTPSCCPTKNTRNQSVLETSHISQNS